MWKIPDRLLEDLTSLKLPQNLNLHRYIKSLLSPQQPQRNFM